MSHALVARDAERRLLIQSLASAANREPVTLLLESEAGVGKTSLLGSLAEEAARMNSLVLSGACIELRGGVAIPYGALVDALRLFVRQEGPEKAIRLSGRSWNALWPLISDSATTAPAAAPESQMRIFGAVLQLADRIGKRAPLVLLLEDIHWADTSTLDLIRYVTRVKTDQQLLLVCSFRPVPPKHQLRDMLGDQDFQRRTQLIRLAPFNRSEMDMFVATLAKRPLPSRRVDRYFELSEGNAYYAEQLVMADDLDSPEVEVPPSLREVMLKRLNELSEDATEVVRLAAVAGREISDDVLSVVSELDERTLEKALTECVQQRILVHHGSTDAYAFQHALLRDTAYRDFLLPRSRKRIHAKLAEALSTQQGARTRLMPELAYHWFEAGRLPEAFSASIRAAGQAAQMHAFPEALAQYERALHLWPDVSEAPLLANASREQILGQAADAARWACKITLALQWVQEAIADVDATIDPSRAGELQERLGSYLWEAGKYDQASNAYAEADRLLEGLPPSAVGSRVQSALATVANRIGDYADALEHAGRAVDLAREVNARAEEGRALSCVGLALAFAGRTDDGEHSLREALSIAAKADHLEDLFRAYGSLGVCLEHAGRLSDAIDALQEGLGRAREHGLLGTRLSGVLANNAAVALSSLGRYAEAADLLDSVVLRRPVDETLYARLTRAEIHVVRGEFDQAQRLLDELRCRAHRDPRFVGPLYVCLADNATWQDQLETAREMVDRGREEIAEAPTARATVQLAAAGLRVAAELRDQTWADELNARIRLVSADSPGADETGLLIRQCHAEQARARGQDTDVMWAAIADGWSTLRQPFRRAYAQWRQAVAAAGSGDRQQASALLRQAYATAETVGAEPLRGCLERMARELKLRLGKPRPHDLTDAEMRVLRVLVTGATNIEIAKILTIAPSTVGVHVGSILRKMNVRNRNEATIRARREGLVAD